MEAVDANRHLNNCLNHQPSTSTRTLTRVRPSYRHALARESHTQRRSDWPCFRVCTEHAYAHGPSGHRCQPGTRPNRDAEASPCGGRRASGARAKRTRPVELCSHNRKTMRTRCRGPWRLSRPRAPLQHARERIAARTTDSPGHPARTPPSWQRQPAPACLPWSS